MNREGRPRLFHFGAFEYLGQMHSTAIMHSRSIHGDTFSLEGITKSVLAMHIEDLLEDIKRRNRTKTTYNICGKHVKLKFQQCFSIYFFS
jgi:hypothetical protein